MERIRQFSETVVTHTTNTKFEYCSITTSPAEYSLSIQLSEMKKAENQPVSLLREKITLGKLPTYLSVEQNHQNKTLGTNQPT
jgi:hypothetical protein